MVEKITLKYIPPSLWILRLEYWEDTKGTIFVNDEFMKVNKYRSSQLLTLKDSLDENIYGVNRKCLCDYKGFKVDWMVEKFSYVSVFLQKYLNHIVFSTKLWKKFHLQS